MPRTVRRHAQHVDKRLRFRLYLYFVITIILFGLLLYNIILSQLTIFFAALGVATGVIIGILTSRMFHISWNHDAKKVVSRLDMFGIFILVLYIGFELMREHIVAYFTHGAQVGTVGFAVLAGIMLGRVMGTSGQIKKVLKEQKIFS